jgi:hypothetical protein
MEASRNPRTLIRWSSALAACGALIFVAAGYFLATTLLISSFSPTYIFVPPVVTACFVVASIVVFVASAFVRHIAKPRPCGAGQAAVSYGNNRHRSRVADSWHHGSLAYRSLRSRPTKR